MPHGRSNMVDMAGKVFVDHNDTAGRDIMHPLGIVHMLAHDTVLERGTRGHSREIRGRIIGKSSPEVTRDTR